jgi:tetratricopeptide (TPR) repeat protein
LSTTHMFGLEPPADIAEAVEVVLDQLLRARELERNGRAEDSLLLARKACASAAQLAYAPLEAEALVQVARALDGRQDADARREAEAAYFDALDLAEAEHRDALAAMIWIRLVQLAVHQDADTRQAFAWWRRAAAAARRIGDPACERAKVHYLRSEIHYRDGAYADAEAEAKLAIEAISEHRPADQRQYQHELARYRGAHAKILEALDRRKDALEEHVRALDLARQALDPAHPDLIKLQMNYGLALKNDGKLKEARAVLEAAYASMMPARCAARVDAGILQVYLSDVHYEADALDDAVRCGRKSLELHEAAGAPAHRRAEACTSIANAELKRGDFQAALDGYQQALSLRLVSCGSAGTQLGINHGSIAEALCGLTRYSDAMAHLAEAERLLAGGHDPQVKAWILTVRGEILVGQQQPAEAIGVLGRALELLAATPDASNYVQATRVLVRAINRIEAMNGLHHETKELAMFESQRIEKSSENYQLCPPPSSSGPNTSGTGHRQAPAVSEPPKKPAPRN